MGGANTVPDSQVRLRRALSFTCLLLQDPPDYAPSSWCRAFVYLRMSAQVSELTPRSLLWTHPAVHTWDFPTACLPPRHLLYPPRGRHTPCVVSPEQKLVPPLVGPFGHVLEDKRRRWRCEAFQVLPAAVKPPQEEEQSSGWWSTGPPLPHFRDTDTRGNLLTFNLWLSLSVNEALPAMLWCSPRRFTWSIKLWTKPKQKQQLRLTCINLSLPCAGARAHTHLEEAKRVARVCLRRRGEVWSISRWRAIEYVHIVRWCFLLVCARALTPRGADAARAHQVKKDALKLETHAPH